ncbi:MAG: ATP-binding protein [Bacteroides sp.]|nr:ATP-binding protein [Bacteroides sp.]MCM1084742.1 ATP-binding protein [Bacteroides sp.]
MSVIVRSSYLEYIVKRLNRGMMLILVGQRRVGKSYMLQQLQSWLKKNAAGSKVLYIDKELQEFRSIRTSDDLYDYVIKKLPAKGKNYLLIDEVQDIDSYENALRSLHAEKRCQIVATGSNAYVFSTELSTRLSGRYIEIPIHSLSYREFLTFHQLENNDKSLLSYLKVGGMPGLRHFDLKDEDQIRDYLQGVYNTVMMRDVVTREEVRNVSFLENLSKFIAENTGKLISMRNIANTMKSHGEKITDMLTSAYIRHLCGAFIISAVPRYDIHGKRLFEQNYKYYFADHGLRNLLCGFNIRGGIEKIIENVVWNYLSEQGFRVTVGILRSAEIDFVATRGDETVYVQATYLLGSQETIQREFGHLAAIKDNYAKYVVSMDPVSGELPEYPGIRHVHLRDFLTTDL